MKLQLVALLCTALIMITAVGCFEWTEDSQGNLKSVGVPGLPLWKAKPQGTAENGAAPSSDSDSLQLDSTESGPAPEWLSELNRLRSNSGLSPVRKNLQLSFDCEAHARYLVQGGPHDPLGFREYAAALGGAAHHEDTSSQFYSADGVECAQGGKRSLGVITAADVAWGQNEVDDIDELFTAPFHRLSLIAPWATVAGYGSFGQFPVRVGALDLRGPYTKNDDMVKYPGDGALVTNGTFLEGEYPNPLAPCPGYKLPVGLPITVQAGRHHVLKLASFSLKGPSGVVETCGFDPFTYQSRDPGEVQNAQRGLASYGAIVLVPRHPLSDGQYLVSVTTATRTLVWNFTVKNPAELAIPPETAFEHTPGSY